MPRSDADSRYMLQIFKQRLSRSGSLMLNSPANSFSVAPPALTVGAAAAAEGLTVRVAIRPADSLKARQQRGGILVKL